MDYNKEINKSGLSNMGDNCNNNTQTNNLTNDSYNTTNNYNINFNQYNFNPEIDSVKNSNNRTLLKSLVGKPITIWAYAIDEYSRIKSKQLVRYTIINVHNQNQYIADHIQLDIPYEIYDENIRHKIILVIGKVYEYEDKKTKEIKQSITAEKLYISNANDMYIAKDFVKQIGNITQENIEWIINRYIHYSPNQKFDLLKKYVSELNELLPCMRKNFISDYIINQYLVNYDPELMNAGNLNILRNNTEAVIEITFLILSLMKKISEGMSELNDIFNYINWILNNMQGLKEDDIDSEKIIKMKAPQEFVDFCDIHNLNINIKKGFMFVKKRNLNFYPRVLDKKEAYIDAFQVLYTDIMNAQNNNNYAEILKNK